MPYLCGRKVVPKRYIPCDFCKKVYLQGETCPCHKGRLGVLEGNTVTNDFKSGIPVSHYSGKVEPIDLIEAQGLGFHEGNIVKYICRYKRKNAPSLTDLKKAMDYLERLIRREEEKADSGK